MSTLHIMGDVEKGQTYPYHHDGHDGHEVHVHEEHHFERLKYRYGCSNTCENGRMPTSRPRSKCNTVTVTMFTILTVLIVATLFTITVYASKHHHFLPAGHLWPTLTVLCLLITFVGLYLINRHRLTNIRHAMEDY